MHPGGGDHTATEAGRNGRASKQHFVAFGQRCFRLNGFDLLSNKVCDFN
jgi:hypothetical protein